MEKDMISVDKWTGNSKLYFLTHLHADHTQGLSSIWARGPLFCSRLTAKLFPVKFPNFNFTLLRVLDVGTWHSIPLPVSHSSMRVQVLAIDAHHCPGAVMFLFRGEFGCLLYTGDFRWEITSKRAMSARTSLLNALNGDVVDILYLDNTYCNPSYDFPPRQVTAQQIVDIIASHPEHDIIIGIDTLGKEDLLLFIAQALSIKIWVWPERLQTMHLLGYHDIFTTNTSLTRVRAVPRYSFSVDTLEGLNTMRPTIGIMPSGLPWVDKSSGRDGGDGIFSGSLLTNRYNRRKWSANGWTRINTLNMNSESVESFHKYMYSVPYSDHSCFVEIEELIKLVQPTNIKGIVTSSRCYVDPLYYFGRLCGASQPALRLHDEQEREKGGERVVSVHAKSHQENDGFQKARRKIQRDANISMLGARMSRVNALRRSQRGVKIAESDS